MALIRGKEVKEAPDQVPANPKLYNMIVAQSKTKFSKRSPASAHWIHSRYIQMGGTFVKSKKQVDPRMRDYVHEAQEKQEDAAKQRIKKPQIGGPMVYSTKPGRV